MMNIFPQIKLVIDEDMPKGEILIVAPRSNPNDTQDGMRLGPKTVFAGDAVLAKNVSGG